MKIATFDYDTRTDIRIHAYGIESITSATVSTSIDLSLLTPRMKAILLNQFKRGYSTYAARGWGMQAGVTRVLESEFKYNLPYINGTAGTFYIKSELFMKQLRVLGMLYGADVYYKQGMPFEVCAYNSTNEMTHKAMQKAALELWFEHTSSKKVCTKMYDAVKEGRKITTEYERMYHK